MSLRNSYLFLYLIACFSKTSAVFLSIPLSDFLHKFLIADIVVRTIKEEDKED